MALGTQLSRQALLFLSRQQRLKDAATQVPPLQRLASRFVAGEDVPQALSVARALNAQGLAVSFDHLNESVREVPGARAEVAEYRRILRRIHLTGVEANVSLKLSQVGLELDQ